MNHPSFLLLQATDGWHTFQISDTTSNRILGSCYFHLADGVAASPLRSPFGSIEYSSKVDDATIDAFIDFIETALKKAGAKKIIIKNPPAGYNADRAIVVETLLFNNGYQILNAEVGSLIHIDDNRSFEEILHPAKRRKLKQSRNLGFEFIKASASKLEEVYHFIRECRAEKNFKLSMSLNALQQSFEIFPEHYHLFVVYHGGNIVGASITVKISEKILYHFMSDYIRKYSDGRPVLILMEGIYIYCHSQGFQIFDLGTSAKNNKPNFPLLNFKKELGAAFTSKFSFEKTIQ